MGSIDNVLKEYKKADTETRLAEFLENRDLRNDFSLIDEREDEFPTPPSSQKGDVEADGPSPRHPPRG